MRSRLVIVSTLLLLIPQSFAANCRTCRGHECQEEDVEFRLCTRFSSNLLFKNYSKLPRNKENLEYGCLKLEYLNGGITDFIENCILTENTNTACQDIAKIISYISCRVEPPIELIIKRDTDTILKQEINGEEFEINRVDVATVQIDNHYPIITKYLEGGTTGDISAATTSFLDDSAEKILNSQNIANEETTTAIVESNFGTYLVSGIYVSLYDVTDKATEPELSTTRSSKGNLTENLVDTTDLLEDQTTRESDNAKFTTTSYLENDLETGLDTLIQNKTVPPFNDETLTNNTITEPINVFEDISSPIAPTLPDESINNEIQVSINNESILTTTTQNFTDFSLDIGVDKTENYIKVNSSERDSTKESTHRTTTENQIFQATVTLNLENETDSTSLSSMSTNNIIIEEIFLQATVFSNLQDNSEASSNDKFPVTLPSSTDFTFATDSTTVTNFERGTTTDSVHSVLPENFIDKVENPVRNTVIEKTTENYSEVDIEADIAQRTTESLPGSSTQIFITEVTIKSFSNNMTVNRSTETTNSLAEEQKNILSELITEDIYRENATTLSDNEHSIAASEHISTIEQQFASTSIEAEGFDSVLTTVVPSNVAATTAEEPISISVINSDESTEYDSLDQTEIPVYFDQDIDLNSSSRIEFSFIVCILFVIYTVVL